MYIHYFIESVAQSLVSYNNLDSRIGVEQNEFEIFECGYFK